MFEEYIEKNILRQLFLCEQFYTKKELDLALFSELLGVCKTTLLNDINCLKKELATEIIHAKRKKDSYSIYFVPSVPLYQLLQKLSIHSLFLKTCRLFLVGQTDYIQLTEAEFISVSKAYNLKKQVLDFLEHSGVHIENHTPVFTEMEHRLLQLTLSLRLGWSDPLPTSDVCHAYNQFIDCVLEKSGRTYNEENLEILRLGFLISMSRQQIAPISFTPKFSSYLTERPIWQYIQLAWQQTQLKNYITENELLFLGAVFNCSEYSFQSFYSIEKDFQRLHQVFIEENEDVKHLIDQLEYHFQQPLLNNKAFERALIRLVRSAWDNYQLFIPGKPHVLTNCQTKLFHELQSLILDWAEALPYDLAINPSLLRLFTIEISGILRLDRTHIHTYIVTDSDVKYLLYKETLEAVTTCQIHISPTIYHELSPDVQILADAENKKILCESALLTPDSSAKENVIPISIEDLETTIRQLIQA
ncbi:DNA-binding protein [Enterococcus sp. BWM-S5]|uniref:DNA-binding protein n=1 Tax=Enterococcus larvae TaxID=2794352 RepID=A0ABS4CII6_9ENTE|nr:DNA-binding protein [Enterococcus larvae]MBP1046258.1 DNA-binding protein [Enterococcus larvae]